MPENRVSWGKIEFQGGKIEFWLFWQNRVSLETHKKRALNLVSDNNGEEFDLCQVSLHYEAEWPLSIVMNGKCMGGYQAVFGLTLRVRQALWCLQNITAKQISRSATNCQQFVQDLDKNNEMFLIRQSRFDC